MVYLNYIGKKQANMLKNNFYKKNSIATNLLKIVFSIYFILTFFITLFHIYFEYQNSQKYISQNISTIISSFSEPLSKALWGYNSLQITTLTNSITNLKIVSFIEIYDENNEIVTEKKEFNKENYISYEKKLYYKDIEDNYYIGYLKAYYKKSIIIQQLKDSFIIILINAVIKSLLLFILFLWAFRKYLLDYLESLTNQLQQIDYNCLDNYQLKIDKNSYELYNLTLEFNKAIFKIQEQNKLMLYQNKLASMGELMEQIAHQWRQPLNNINGITGGLKFRIKKDMYDKKYFIKELEKSEDVTKYLSSTINDFMNFYKQNREKKDIYLKDIIDSTLNIVQHIINKNNIKTIISRYDNIKLITYGNELSHILLNFINNSIDALKEIESEDKFIFIDINIEKEFITLSIKDNANGVKDEIKDKVFQPYITTKESSLGTGLGLYMCYEIVTKQLNADIWFRNLNYSYNNKRYKGAEFSIKIALH